MAGDHPGVPGIGDAPFNAGGRRATRNDDLDEAVEGHDALDRDPAADRGGIPALCGKHGLQQLAVLRQPRPDHRQVPGRTLAFAERGECVESGQQVRLGKRTGTGPAHDMLRQHIKAARPERLAGQKQITLPESQRIETEPTRDHIDLALGRP